VLSVLDFGEVERMPYIEMDFVRGMTLSFALAQAGQLPALAALRMARQIAWALATAHGQQLMHGGLKPDNILIEGNGDVKVMDFGLGMPVRINQPIPNPGFLAPEQLEAKEPDSRADFYSFGAVVYATATGKLPFPGSTAEEVRQKMATTQPDPPTSYAADLSPQLEKIVLECLSINPEGRFDTIDDLVKALEAID
jgi:serine/threonine-protein kinase